MKVCKNCGSAHGSDAKYCNVCGSRLPQSSPSRVWLWALAALCLFLTGMWLSTWFELRQVRSNLDSRDMLDSALVSRYDHRYDSLRREYLHLDALKCSADHRLTDFQEMVGRVYPLIIDSVEIGNVNRIQQLLTAFGGRISSSETQYLQPLVHYRGIKHGAIELYVKWYDPDGKMRVGESSPPGYSQQNEVYVYEESKTLKLKGWGSESAGNWRAGDYRLEIWHQGMLLYNKRFRIY